MHAVLHGSLIGTHLVNVVTAQVLTASLDYGTFQGAYSAEYNISYWQKIPFAAPPVGENRFRAPQPPLKITNDTYNSSQTFDMCPQRTVNGSEDCLYLGLYGRPWSLGQPLRPVVLTFYGGGFIQGSASFTLPPSAYPILNVSSESNMIFVYPNYRTNAFGFLPGREVKHDAYSDANAGLLDQSMALHWVSKYIEKFGGDPGKVTVWGQSAGGGSAIAQSIGDQSVSAGYDAKRKKTDRPLIRQALASSPFWPKTYAVDAPEAQYLYDILASLTGCAGPESLKCLKQADVQTIRNASLAISTSQQYTTSSFSWGPVIDGVLLREPLSVASTRGALIVDGYGMYNTHEGENFIPPGLKSSVDTGSPAFNSSVASFEKWLSGYLPGLSENDLGSLKQLYPITGNSENVASYNDSYTRAGLIFRDSTLACPAYWLAGSAQDGSWIGEYTISPATHASDVYWWNTVNVAQQQDPFHYTGYAGAMASFFMTGDPNALKLTSSDVSGLPALTSNQEWVIDAEGFRTSPIGPLEKRCAFWKTVASKVPI
ncbi:carboxylesterase [Xylariaceae sp. FL1272]|nr:carboxylesterase [Xylariaceae sp. FL1272]